MNVSRHFVQHPLNKSMARSDRPPPAGWSAALHRSYSSEHEAPKNVTKYGVIEMDENREPLYLMVKNMVSCRCSLKTHPLIGAIEWNLDGFFGDSTRIWVMLEGFWLFNGLCLISIGNIVGNHQRLGYWSTYQPLSTDWSNTCTVFLGEHLRFKLQNKVYTIKFNGVFVLHRNTGTIIPFHQGWNCLWLDHDMDRAGHGVYHPIRGSS